MRHITFAIIHGSWQCTKGWEAVARGLVQQGYEVKLIDLPGHGKNSNDAFSHITFNTYVRYVCKALASIDNSHKIILVGHSFAGLVISKVVEYIPVDNLVYVAAFLPKHNESLLSLMTMNTIAGLKDHVVIDTKAHATYLKKEGLAPLLFNGCDAETMTNQLALLQPEPMHPPSEKIPVNASILKCIPKDYIECVEDRCVSINLQRKMHERGPCRVHTLPTGHSPFLSMPEALTAILANKLSLFSTASFL